MKTHFKPLVLAAILGTAALSAMAQPADDAPQDGSHMAHVREHMQERMTKHLNELKAKLKLSPQQEANWTTYVAAMKPGPAASQAPRPEDWAKLTTPERLDKLRELRKTHEAEFDKRDDATRNFYSSLNADQKKIFDDQTARHMQDGHRPHNGPGPH